MQTIIKLVRAGMLVSSVTLFGCVPVNETESTAILESVQGTFSPSDTVTPELYKLPTSSTNPGLAAQSWSILGREDIAKTLDATESEVSACDAIVGSPYGWANVAKHISEVAINHRVVIINESHWVTRHRQMTRMLLPELRKLGFEVLAAETLFNSSSDIAPVEFREGNSWPHLNDGFYSREPIFGRMLRDAKALGFRTVAYEYAQKPSGTLQEPETDHIEDREDGQAANIAKIIETMAPHEKLVVHVGYSHAREYPTDSEEGAGRVWMAARLLERTGINPLTISQTVCRSREEQPFLALPPSIRDKASFDISISHPVTDFVRGRPNWRRQIGDVEVAIPAVFRSQKLPMVIEAFAADEPSEAVPVDRVFTSGEDGVSLLLPPGRYRVRAVVPE